MTTIIEKFNPKIEFSESEFVSMLFYLGYLTIAEERLGNAVLKIPNNVMRELYASFFLKIMEEARDQVIGYSKLEQINSGQLVPGLF